MNYDTLIHYIGHYGYAALFFALWLGIIGMPIPDEIMVWTLVFFVVGQYAGSRVESIVTMSFPYGKYTSDYRC